MNRKKLISLCLVLLLLLSVLAGCANASEPTENDQAQTVPPVSSPAVEQKVAPVSFSDMAGHEITLDEPATRIVALTAADCEILCALGAGDLLVGRGEYCDYPAEVMNISSVQSGSETNIEQIVALKPQVLLMSNMAQTEDQIAALENAGIKVVVSDVKDIEGVYTAITMIGKLAGRDTEAVALIDHMKITFSDIAAKVPADGAKKTIYFEVSPLEYGLWAAGNNTFMNEIAQMLGLTNIFSDVDTWAEISEEQVIARNPDYIVTITMFNGQGPKPEEEIVARKGWENITAVKNAAILNLQNNELSRPGPRLADGANMLYEFIYVTMANKNAA